MTREESVEQQLRAFLDDRLPPGELTITYDDLHPLHGGLRLTIRGDGTVDQQTVRTAARPAHPVDPADLRALVQLLLDLQAWRQTVPERPPVPDESRASLRLQAGPASSETWEWYNDLTRNDRLIRIRTAMQDAAWQ